MLSRGSTLSPHGEVLAGQWGDAHEFGGETGGVRLHALESSPGAVTEQRESGQEASSRRREARRHLSRRALVGLCPMAHSEDRVTMRWDSSG